MVAAQRPAAPCPRPVDVVQVLGSAFAFPLVRACTAIDDRILYAQRMWLTPRLPESGAGHTTDARRRPRWTDPLTRPGAASTQDTRRPGGSRAPDPQARHRMAGGLRPLSTGSARGLSRRPRPQLLGPAVAARRGPRPGHLARRRDADRRPAASGRGHCDRCGPCRSRRPPGVGARAPGHPQGPGQRRAGLPAGAPRPVGPAAGLGDRQAMAAGNGRRRPLHRGCALVRRGNRRHARGPQSAARPSEQHR